MSDEVSKSLSNKLDELLEVTSQLQKDVKALQQPTQASAVSRRLVASSFGGALLPSASGQLRTPTPLTSSSAGGGASSDLLPLLEGDYLVVKDLNADTRGYVTGDSANRECGVQLAEPEEAARAASTFDNYVFQVYPALSYRSQKEAEKTPSRSPAAPRNLGVGGEGAEVEPEDDAAVLEERAANEIRLNESVVAAVASGARRGVIRYGSAVQLRHVQSGEWLTCWPIAAKKDSACRKVSLASGSSGAGFKLRPRFKAQSEGSAAFYSHSVQFESMELPGMFLHTSPFPLNDPLPLSATAITMGENSGSTSAFPRCLLSTPIVELNASVQPATFALRRYASFEPGASQLLRTSLCSFRFFHAQSESFLQASCDADKISSPFSRPFIAPGENKSDSPNVGLENGGHGVVLPAHLPYLRAMNTHGKAQAPDPTDARNHSTKALWCFEPLDRSQASVLQWGASVRVKHVPSGKYLCVNTSQGPLYQVAAGEDWYGCSLVDDAAISEDELLENRFADPQSLVFRVEGDGGSDGGSMPLSELNIRIGHIRKVSTHDGNGHPTTQTLTLWLHNTDEVKPKLHRLQAGGASESDEGQHQDSTHHRASEPAAPGLLVVFSTVRASQDALRLMPARSEESRAVARIKAFVPKLLDYSIRLAQPDSPEPTAAALRDICHTVLQVISLQCRGRFELLDQKIDWVAKANRTLPAEFGALFDAEPFAEMQNASRDLKLVDAAFAMGLAPYTRAYPAKPFVEDNEVSTLPGPRGVQKLVHACLQRMVAANSMSQLYLGRRSCLTGDGPAGAPVRRGYLEVLKRQLEDALGAAVTLSKLLSSNRKLLVEHATPSLVADFARMVRELGPQPRLMSFFEAICVVDSVPVMANQEMLLRHLWHDPSTRRELFLEVVELPVELLAKLGTPLPELPQVKRSLTGYSLANQKPVAEMEPPSQYLGKTEAEGRNTSVFLKWSGHSSWHEGMLGHLYFAPEALGLQVYSFGGSELVRAEDLLWVLEPERLCHTVTGTSWKDYVARRESDPNIKKQFSRTYQLASYFVASQRLLTRMCEGRSYNCISALESSFGYEMLIHMAASSCIPADVRGECFNLLRLLYLDRFPQQPFCGRPSLPQQLWIYEAPGTDPDDLIGCPVIAAHPPLQDDKNTGGKDTSALPSFYLLKSHPCRNDPNPLLGMNGHTKFFLTRKASNHFLEENFQSGRLSNSQRGTNAMAMAVVCIINNLLSFGFQSTYPKIQLLVKGLMRLLDGRNDVKEVPLDVVGDNDEAEERPFEPLSARFKLSASGQTVTAVKRACIDCLIQVTHFRTEYRLNKLMRVFKDLCRSKSMLHEMKRFHRLVESHRESEYEGNILTHIFKQFEELFESSDGSALDLAKLSGLNVDAILLDCLMYEDDALHAKAFELLERNYTMRALLINAAKSVILLHRPDFAHDEMAKNPNPLLKSEKKRLRLPTDIGASAIDNYEDLSCAVGYLLFLIRSTQVWAVQSEINGPFELDKHHQVLNICDRLTTFLWLPTKAVNDGQTAIGDLHDEGFDIGIGMQMLTLGMGHKDVELAKIEDSAPVSTTIGGDEEEKKAELNSTHQDVLRAMNLHTSLIAALRVDYNLAFSGNSEASFKDKQKSRSILLRTVRAMVKLLELFVSSNRTNQELIFTSALPLLRSHLSGLQHPLGLEVNSQLEPEPALGVATVIIECLRGNDFLIMNKVPLDIFSEYGYLLEAEPEISSSPMLDFFEIVCLEGRSYRNQDSVLDVFLSNHMARFRSFALASFFVGTEPSLLKPNRLVDVLAATVKGRNVVNAARLQAHDFSIETTISAIAYLVHTNAGSNKGGWGLAASSHFQSLLNFLSLILPCLVVDPRLFADRSMLWTFFEDGCNPLLDAYASDLEAANDVAVRHTELAILPCLVSATHLIEAAKTLGVAAALQVPALVGSSKSAGAHDSLYAHAMRIERLGQGAISKAAASLRVQLRIYIFEEVSDVDTKTGQIIDEIPKKEDGLVASGKDDALMDDSRDTAFTEPAVLFDYFVEAISCNPKVNTRLLQRRFNLVTVMEDASHFTDPKGSQNDHGADNGEGIHAFDAAFEAFDLVGSAFTAIGDAVSEGVGLSQAQAEKSANEAPHGVRIEWSQLVNRMVAFVKSHNYADDEMPCIRAHNLLRSHLEKARSDKTKGILDVMDMNEEKLNLFRSCQVNLDSRGVTAIALTAIATHAPGIPDNSAASGAKLLYELMCSGNPKVQVTVQDYIENQDKDARFLKHMKALMLAATKAVAERNAQQSAGVAFQPLLAITRREYAEATATLKLLQAMIEGHNNDLQNLLREQPDQPVDINVVSIALDLFAAQAETMYLLHRMSEPAMELLLATMAFLSEAMEGPCEQNQEQFVRHAGALAALKNVLQSPFHSRVAKASIMRVKNKSMCLLAASLEGRKDRYVHEMLVELIEPSILRKYKADVAEYIAKLEEGRSFLEGGRLLEGFGSTSNNEHQKRMDDAVTGLVCLQSTITQLQLVRSFSDRNEISNLAADANNGATFRPTLEADEKLLRSTVASVEVMWRNRIEFVSFPYPPESAFLSSTSKTEFLDTVSLATSEGRMKELIKAEPGLTAETQQVYSLAQKGSLYSLMHRNFSSFKMLQYALVLLLNLNIVMSSYGKDTEGGPGLKMEGYNSPLYAALGTTPMDSKYNTSLLITWVLAVPNFLGYFVLAAFMGITEIPIIIRTIDQNVLDRRAEAAAGQDVVYRDPGAFTWWGVTLVFNVVFIVQHRAAYPGKPESELYLFLIFGINLPWTLRCIRNYVLVADTAPSRLFCIAYDTLLLKPFLRNQSLLVFCSLNGFLETPYFTLMLLDVVNISPTIQSLVKSVTTPGAQLGIVAYLFVIMVVIFASFGLQLFESDFIYDEFYEDDADDQSEPNPRGCHSVVSCAWLIMYRGVPAGSLDAVLDNVDNRDSHYLLRVGFDMLFFVVVGIILFNVITGLMVDTFSSLREEAAERIDKLTNECFVCGFTRTAYDDIGMTSPSFDLHQAKHHYIWNYLFFIQYLNAKDETEYSGVESHVHQMLEANSQEWIPTRTCFAAQNFGLFDASREHQMEARLSQQVESGFRSMKAGLGRVEERIAQIEASSRED